MTGGNLRQAAEEMWEACGQDAHRVASEIAEDHKRRGDLRATREAQRLAQAVRFYIGPTPHPKRPYGNQRPVRAVPMIGMASLRADIQAMIEHVQ